MQTSEQIGSQENKSEEKNNQETEIELNIRQLARGSMEKNMAGKAKSATLCLSKDCRWILQIKKKKVLSASKLKTINKEQKHIWNIIPVLRLIYIYMEKDYIRTASK